MKITRSVYRLFYIALFSINFFCGLSAAEQLPAAAPGDVGMSAEKLALIKPAVGKLIDEEKIAGASVIVARHGKIVFDETFGLMDLKTGKKVEKDTIFRFYSMTKPVTSVAVMMLVEQGKIQLDDPVSKHIPQFKGLKVYNKSGQHTEPARPMTVRDLMRHTSGLTYGIFGNTPVDKMYRAKNVLDRNSSLQNMADKLGQIPLLYEPGTKWHYSVSTDVLGCLIENVSKMPLDEFFEQNIFKPLGMKDTGFFVPEDKADRFASCYGPGLNKSLILKDDRKTSEFLSKPVKYSGGGGLVSTGADYMRFCLMLLNGGQLNSTRLLKEQTVNQMTTNQLPKGVYRIPGGGFGLGFSVQLFKAKAPKGEYGWGGAASTHFWISPKHDLIVIALSQCMPFSARLENTIKPIVYDAIIN